MTRTVWDVLGIAETLDVAAIRSAYARVLKSIDVDTEPQRYIELRNARDQAVYDARTAAADTPAVVPDGDPILAADPPLADIAPGTFEEHMTALAGLLTGDPQGDAAPADDGLMLAHFRALLGDSRMTEIAFATRAETQLAELIAMALPRSMALVEPAITAFGWRDPVGVDTPAPIVAIRDAAEHRRRDEAIDGGQDAGDSDPDVAFRAAEYAALVALLVPQQEDPPALTNDQKHAAQQHFESLLVDPRMEVVTFRVGAEAQIAQLIAYAIPRSDCVVERAIDFFDWQAEEDRVDQSGAVAYILNRGRGLRFLAAVQRPDHPHHVAWNELTTPLGVKGRFWDHVPDTSVDQLLAAIRFEQPLLEQELNPDRVAWWDQKLAKRRPISVYNPPPSGKKSMPIGAIVWLSLLFLVGIGNIIGRLDDPQAQYNATGFPAPTFPVAPGQPSSLTGGQSTAVEDIGPVLAEIGGRELTLTGLQLSNPALAKELEALWQSAGEKKVDISDFQRSIERLLLARITMIVMTSEDANLIVAHQTMRLNDLKKRASVPVDCAELGRPGKLAINDVPSDLSDEQKQFFAKILSADSPQSRMPARVDRSTVDAAIAAVATRIGTTPDRTALILAGKTGSASDQCLAHIAELETALAFPRYQGVPLLRLL